MVVWTGPIARRQTLAADDLAAIRALEARCNGADGLALKLNWDLMQSRSPEETSDFLAHADGALVGYVALDGDGPEVELTGMVHPQHRRRGIARALVAAALTECRRRGTARALLVCERASATGRAFAAALAARFSFAEYHLELAATGDPATPASGLHLRRAERADIPRLAEFQARCFAETDDAPDALTARMTRRFDDPASRYYFALVGDEPVGSLGVLCEEGQVYIRGVGILPEQRRHGYGRQMLAATVSALRGEGRTHFALDVATENERALELYRSCGFRETNVYEYYHLPLE